MNRDPYSIALTNALKEIDKAYPDITHSFIFTSDNTIMGEYEVDQKIMDQMQEFLETIKEKAKVIGNLKNVHIKAKNGNLNISMINDDFCLVMATTKNMDKNQVISITKIILPTILKTLDIVTAEPLQAPPILKELKVDTLSGFFTRDTVQIDTETILEWSKTKPDNLLLTEDDVQEIIDHVRIETFGGNSTMCKVKEIDERKLKGRNIIRIPEKICNSLEIKKGDIVKVKPLL